MTGLLNSSSCIIDVRYVADSVLYVMEKYGRKCTWEMAEAQVEACPSSTSHSLREKGASSDFIFVAKCVLFSSIPASPNKNINRDARDFASHRWYIWHMYILLNEL